MDDDPREVLKAAGVECDAVKDWRFVVETAAWRDDRLQREALTRSGNRAILALARLVAKYKWQRDECANELGRKLAADYEYEATKPFAASDVIVDLNRRWDERGTQ